MNPYEPSEVRSPWDVPTPVDVAELHQRAERGLLEAVDEVRRTGRSALRVLTGEIGAGRSHLLTRLVRSSAGGLALSVQSTVAPERPLCAVLGRVAADLARPGPEGADQLTTLVARALCGPVPGAPMAQLEALRLSPRRWQSALNARLLEIASRHPDTDAEVLDHLLRMPFEPEQRRELMWWWLAGAPLEVAQFHGLGFDGNVDDDGVASSVLRTITALAGAAGAPVVIAFDGVESADPTPGWAERLARLSAQLVARLPSTLVVLSVRTPAWRSQLAPRLASTPPGVVVLELDELRLEQAHAVARARAGEAGLHPIGNADVELAWAEAPVVRSLLDALRARWSARVRGEEPIPAHAVSSRPPLARPSRPVSVVPRAPSIRLPSVPPSEILGDASPAEHPLGGAFRPSDAPPLGPPPAERRSAPPRPRSWVPRPSYDPPATLDLPRIGGAEPSRPSARPPIAAEPLPVPEASDSSPPAPRSPTPRSDAPPALDAVEVGGLATWPPGPFPSLEHTTDDVEALMADLDDADSADDLILAEAPARSTSELAAELPAADSVVEDLDVWASELVQDLLVPPVIDTAMLAANPALREAMVGDLEMPPPLPTPVASPVLRTDAAAPEDETGGEAEPECIEAAEAEPAALESIEAAEAESVALESIEVESVALDATEPVDLESIEAATAVVVDATEPVALPDPVEPVDLESIEAEATAPADATEPVALPDVAEPVDLESIEAEAAEEDESGDEDPDQGVAERTVAYELDILRAALGDEDASSEDEALDPTPSSDRTVALGPEIAAELAASLAARRRGVEARTGEGYGHADEAGSGRGLLDRARAEPPADDRVGPASWSAPSSWDDDDDDDEVYTESDPALTGPIDVTVLQHIRDLASGAVAADGLDEEPSWIGPEAPAASAEAVADALARPVAGLGPEAIRPDPLERTVVMQIVDDFGDDDDLQDKIVPRLDVSALGPAALELDTRASDAVVWRALERELEAALVSGDAPADFEDSLPLVLSALASFGSPTTTCDVVTDALPRDLLAILRHEDAPVVIADGNHPSGGGFAYRARWVVDLLRRWRAREPRFRAVLLRDADLRIPKRWKKGNEYVRELEREGGALIRVSRRDRAILAVTRRALRGELELGVELGLVILAAARWPVLYGADVVKALLPAAAPHPRSALPPGRTDPDGL